MLYVILIAAVVIFLLIFVDRPVLKARFKDGHLTSVKGHMPPSLKHNLQEIGEREPFDGILRAYNATPSMRLVFSKDIPKKTQQHIRNVFPHQCFPQKGKKRA